MYELTGFQRDLPHTPSQGWRIRRGSPSRASWTTIIEMRSITVDCIPTSIRWSKRDWSTRAGRTIGRTNILSRTAERVRSRPDASGKLRWPEKRLRQRPETDVIRLFQNIAPQILGESANFTV